jgi:hypothetical protein
MVTTEVRVERRREIHMPPGPAIDAEDVVVASRERGSLPTRTAWLLVLASFLLYSANFREVSGADTIPTRLLPIELVRHQQLHLDHYFRNAPAGRPGYFWVQLVGEHYRSSYPVVPAILAVPVYVVPVLLGVRGDHWTPINLLSKVAASLMAALSVGLVYLVAVTLHSPLGASAENAPLAVAVVYAVATATWSVSSQGLWGHAPTQLAMATALCALVRPPGRSTLPGLAGLATGVMLACRPTTVLMAAVFATYVLRTESLRSIVRYLGVGSAVVAAVLVYNVTIFDSPQGGYAEINRTHAKWHGVAETWTPSVVTGLLGLLVSPSRGLFVYSPILLLALPGVLKGLRGRPEGMLPYLSVGVIASLLLLGSYTVWWGGHSFGPRLLSDFMPALALLTMPAWPLVWSSPPWRALAVVLFACSVLVQGVGAFYYPSRTEVDWNASPRDVDRAHERLWDWRDTQLLRLLRNGPATPGFRAGP